MHMNQLLLESAFTVNWRTANLFSMLDSSWWQTLLKKTNALRCIWASIGRIPVSIYIQPDLDILLVMRVTALLFVFDTFLIVLMVSTTVLIIPCHIVGLVKHRFYIYAEVILGQGHWYHGSHYRIDCMHFFLILLYFHLRLLKYWISLMLFE